MVYTSDDLHALFLDEIARAGLILNANSLYVASLDDHVLMPVSSIGLLPINPAKPLEERPPEARLTLITVAPNEVSLHILYRCFITRALHGEYRARLNDVHNYFGQCLNKPHQDQHMFSALTVRAELAASTDGDEPEWYVSLWPLRIGVYAHLARLSSEGTLDEMTMDSLRARIPPVLRHIREQLATLGGAVATWRGAQRP
ncbi:MAG TPA: hypothetical protein VJG32_13180 [Anaerolineae bacterium]|nr:hypothetical protein [Anaerolineae bacterium]